MELQMLLGSGLGDLRFPVLQEGVQWDTERRGVPGKLTFTLVDPGGPLEEGMAVGLTADGTPVFDGFLFSQKRDRDGLVRCVACDQLRYLKNKDTYVYENKTASEVLRMIADDFQLRAGEIEDTRFKIASRVEDNKTLLDVIYTALDLTLCSTGRQYVLYDDRGGLTLRDIENMKIDRILDAGAAEDFDYASGIDGETYNKIKLARGDKETGKREIYVAQHGANIEKWGVLQYFDTLDEKENGQARADMLLRLYNHPTRSLTVKNAFGDLRVRAGTSLPVRLDLGGLTVNHYMVVEKARHRFDEGMHRMDLTLRGGEIRA